MNESQKIIQIFSAYKRVTPEEIQGKFSPELTKICVYLTYKITRQNYSHLARIFRTSFHGISRHMENVAVRMKEDETYKAEVELYKKMIEDKLGRKPKKKQTIESIKPLLRVTKLGGKAVCNSSGKALYLV